MHVAVIDIGKTNAKLALVETGGMRETDVVTLPNRVRGTAPYPHFDVDGIWTFLLDGLRAFHADHGIDAISVTTHGAAGALLDAQGGLAAPILDYEHDGPDRFSAAYDALRPDFAETGSPRLPMGLNLGAQLHWLLETRPGLDSRCARFVTYPQFWSGRLSGEYRCDFSSLGCHTDLWAPHRAGFSGLVARLGLAGRMAPVARADARLGPVQPEIARATGLPPETPVYCGIHDSNASLLPHLRGRDQPFAVVSTGTWVISMAVGGAGETLAPERDTLINVDAFGRPVPSARFMGGREYDRMRGETAAAGAEDIARVLARDIFLLPSVEPASGPFAGRVGGWHGPGATAREKSVALSFYLALMTAECLRLIGARGPILVEGPFGRNPLYLDMLAAATGRPVQPCGSATGTSIGAAMLAGETAASRALSQGSRRQTPGLDAYADRWRAAVSSSRD